MTAPTQSQRGIHGGHVLAWMLAFFAVIVLADATLIYKAVATFGGVDNANAYRDGLAYNRRIDRAKRQSQLGWRDSVDVLMNPARIRVSLRDSAASPLSGLDVEVSLGRPATVHSDAVLHPAETSPGIFEAALGDGAEGGNWIATLRAYEKARPSEAVFQSRRRLWIAP
jgi:nitrogen fixation protein FixH